MQNLWKSLITISIMMIYLTSKGQEKHLELLDTIPDKLGFAGSFGGKLGNGIVSAGGAQFKDGVPPWDSGVKIWTDKLFYLENEKSTWVELGKLPFKVGYGASASFNGKFYIAGGSNQKVHFNKVFEISIDNQQINFVELPKLPISLANCSFSQYGSNWFVLGGQEDVDSKTALNRVFKLDLEDVKSGWVELPPLPDNGRILSASAVNELGLFVFSGASLNDGKRKYLKDGFKFNGVKWVEIEGCPEAITAVSNPGVELQKNQFTFLSGDNGELVDSELRENHPGFSRKVFTYNAEKDHWEITYEIPSQIKTERGELKKIIAPVTATAIHWNNSVVIIGGEAKPAVRTNQVLKFK